MIGEGEERVPIGLDHSVGTIGPVHAELVGVMEEIIGGHGVEPRLIDAILIYILIVIPFERNEGTGRDECEEPMLVKGKFIGLAPKLMQVGRKPIWIFADFFGEAFFSAAIGNGAAEPERGSSGSGTGHGRDEGKTFVKCASDEGGFSGA